MRRYYQNSTCEIRKSEFRIRVSGSFFNHEAHPVRQSQLNAIDTNARISISYPARHTLRCHKALKLCDKLSYFGENRDVPYIESQRYMTAFYWGFFSKCFIYELFIKNKFFLSTSNDSIFVQELNSVDKTLFFIYNSRIINA